MSFIEEIPCFEVLSSVVFFIEGPFEDAHIPQAIASTSSATVMWTNPAGRKGSAS